MGKFERFACDGASDGGCALSLIGVDARYQRLMSGPRRCVRSGPETLASRPEVPKTWISRSLTDARSRWGPAPFEVVVDGGRGGAHAVRELIERGGGVALFSAGAGVFIAVEGVLLVGVFAADRGVVGDELGGALLALVVLDDGGQAFGGGVELLEDLGGCGVRRARAWRGPRQARGGPARGSLTPAYHSG